MANYETLVDDIYGALAEGQIDIELFHHEEPEHNKEGEYIRLSSVGQPCARKFWYGLNRYEAAEPLRPQANLMFMIGHVIEHVVLDVARKAGHDVEYEQKEVEVNGVLGHLDAVIDGLVVDVKSASPYSFSRFQSANGLEEREDKFGYLSQLASYLSAVRDDSCVLYPNRAAFLAINKVTGELALDVKEFSDEDLQRNLDLIEQRKEIAVKTAVPARGFEDKPIGKSGNRGLDTNCSYCQFKHECWPGLRTFLYSNGPSFLTEVVKTPNVPEAES